MTRALLDEARRHDAAMTEGPWVSERDDAEYGEVYSEDPYKLVVQTGRAPVAANAAGIAWLRTNLRGLLDAHEQALGEVERQNLDYYTALDDADQLRVSIGEQALVIEQQDRDMERLRAELDRAVSENFAFNVKVATEINEARSDRDKHEREATRLRAALQEALIHWRPPPLTHQEKARKDEIWSLAHAEPTTIKGAP